MSPLELSSSSSMKTVTFSLSPLLLLLLLLHFVLLHAAEAINTVHERCGSTFTCGTLHEMKFPFFSTHMPSECGLFMMDCDAKVPKIQFERRGKWYEVERITQGNNMTITDLELQRALNSAQCGGDISRFALPDSPWLSSTTVYKCDRGVVDNIGLGERFAYENCGRDGLYYVLPEDSSAQLPRECSAFKIPHSWAPSKSRRNPSLNPTFCVDISPVDECYECHYRGGTCSIGPERNLTCIGEKKDGKSNHRGVELGLGIGGSLALIILAAMLIIPWFVRRNDDSSRRTSNPDLEASHVFFKVPIFSYQELEKATRFFSNDRLLGDGGFGTVYYGKLRDGREVAVKFLYEHNYRRHQQFINEIEILTRLQHKNLVSLYGCTSRRSRELLLVYEFVPNGTIADHLHGDPSRRGSLPWPMRMSIAVETASALAYLHASDVIHRDVKTANILLDNNFGVKVADFGISRLLPDDVTHVSTSPQGTPGYVDPEYYQSYHLTDKSDVYSFGVVLVELISSKPAVDITRSKSEINLSNFAINKIQQQAYDDLIDPVLGHKTDAKVREMAEMVAEVAFRCLQQDRAMRPTMDEVLRELQRIQNEESAFQDHEENQRDAEEMKRRTPQRFPPCWSETLPVKNIREPPSPKSVTEQWVSKSSTPDTSA